MSRLPRMLVLLLVACARDRGTTAPAPVDPWPPPAAANAAPTPPAPTSAPGVDLPGEPGDRPVQHAWDEANLERLHGYWRDLACFRARVRAAGEAARGSRPGSAPDEAWYQFKIPYLQEVDAWQRRLFAGEPRVLERSHLIGWLIEAHELVAHTYPRAYSDGGDADAITGGDAQWLTLERQVHAYALALDGAWEAANSARPPCSAP